VKTALVTGASAGIGEAFAEVFAAEGFNLVLVARREDRLHALAARLTERHRVTAHVVAADLADPEAPARICAELSTRGITVDALVNNAGYGVPGTFVASPWQWHQDMLQVMVIGLAELTHRLLPGMIERGYGRIINVASLAGLVPAPAGHTLYAAAKALVIKFSEALSNEVRKHNVHVTAVCPGFTLSEFHDVTGTREQMKSLPPWMWMDSPTVARQGFDAVMAGTPIYINGRVNRSIAVLVRYVPERLVKAIGRRFGRSYRKT
jgi:uncharacterized protein